MKVIELTGGYYEMGRRHAQQVQDLRPRIVKAMRQRLETLTSSQADLQPHAAELAVAWEEVARPTLEMLRGIAEGLTLEWEPFFRYTIASYLGDRTQRPADGEGCTAWAAAASVTRNGLPILAKNRDYRPTHQAIQCLARVKPVNGYRCLYVTSAGSPGVFSSGMNETGLVVADTHVTPQVIGPGVARYSVMMEILEHCNDVGSALDYLRQVLHTGDGTLLLLDLAGEMAVFEAGHTIYGVLLPEQDFVVSTNHFSSPQLRDGWVDRYPPELRGNSQNRYARVVSALGAARGRVDASWAQALMSDHGGSQPTDDDRRRRAICRHADLSSRSTTISTALYLPQERTLLFANGHPCQAEFQAWSVV
jgi:isopenicillin-N N-acyltransferase-like protein